MTQANFRHLLDKNNSRAILQIDLDGKPAAHVSLTASELEAVIQGLSRMRAEMSEPVALELDPTRTIETVREPACQVAQHDEPAGAGLRLRHPGLGWIGFHLPSPQARGVGQALLAIAENLDSKAAR